jgi:hypothetical protein
MGVAAPAIALVGTVAGIASQRSQIAANNRAARLQQEANNRASRIRLMGLDMREEQLKQQYELDKLGIQARADMADLNFQVQSIESKIQAAQQLTGIDEVQAQRMLDSVSKQYEAARQAYLQRQELNSRESQQLNVAAQAYSQTAQTQSSLINALKQGDTQLADLIARNSGVAYSSGKESQALFQQQEFEIMKAMLQSTQMNERLTEDLLFNSEYNDLLNRAIQASLAANQSAISAEEAATGKGANSAKEITQIADKGAQRVNTLASALVPQVEAMELSQAGIDLAYAKEAIANNRLEARFGTAAQNAQIEQTIRRPSLLGDLTQIGMSAVPLVSRLSFFNQQQTTPSTLNFDLGQPIYRQPTGLSLDLAQSIYRPPTTPYQIRDYVRP